ncbi:3-oxoacyl-[acyl-carrier-protein] synthase III C-terminal domain-containing protein [Robertmurraya massiliosenegalensis]|uniref:type III polyketide synthase n=1 Tax=Robertmurraya TaxID=2837507 RepID=UPI0039A45DA1
MPQIVSVAEVHPTYVIKQQEVMNFARNLFNNSFKDIDRLLKVFQSGQIEKRHFVKGLEWFEKEHSFAEKNDIYIDNAVELGTEAIKKCLQSETFLKKQLAFEEVDAIFTISSTGIATPSIEARIMNKLPCTPFIKRIPLWGLGCGGGASGLSRAYEYCLAYPNAKVLILAIEFCSLTFQKNDRSKSNLIGTSLFADGVACALMVGDGVNRQEFQKISSVPSVLSTQSTTLKNSLDVMGWQVKNEGFFVVFSKDIPTIIEKELKPAVFHFLKLSGHHMSEIQHFIAHPGGRKVLEAYERALSIPSAQTEVSANVLKEFGNMSSVTIFYVLKRFMEVGKEDDLGLATALGPGFSSEMLLLRWVK